MWRVSRFCGKVSHMSTHDQDALTDAVIDFAGTERLELSNPDLMAERFNGPPESMKDFARLIGVPVYQVEDLAFDEVRIVYHDGHTLTVSL